MIFIDKEGGYMDEKEKKYFWNGVFLGLIIGIILFVVVFHIIQCLSD